MSNAFVSLLKKAVGIPEKKSGGSCCGTVPAGLVAVEPEEKATTNSSCCGGK